MNETNLYQDIAARTGGAFLLGVVGPVRTGKSTFIKRFMETLVIPRIENTYTRERARDELPQSGSGKTIMTAEPKFVPEDAVTIHLAENTELSVRLVDCVGYMVEGASGQFEDGNERMVTTPWYEEEISMTDAAEKGTQKVISEHSTVGIVVTTDGSICEIPRESYLAAEERVIRELQEIGKPFLVLLNCVDPNSSQARELSAQMSEQYGVECIPVNCLNLSEEGILNLLNAVLQEFPLKSMGIYLPDWLDALDVSAPLKTELLEKIRTAASGVEKMKDCQAAVSCLCESENISGVSFQGKDLGTGSVSLQVQLPRDLYYHTISEETGLQIENDRDLIEILSEMGGIKTEYDRLKDALEEVRKTGYGVVMPDSSEMHMEEPQIVRQGGKYSVKLKASAPAIHLLMTNIETEVTPAIGGETASEDIISFLLQGFDGDVNRIWQSNIFGKSLDELAEEGLTAKIQALPEGARRKLQMTLQRIINEGSGRLICILL